MTTVFKLRCSGWHDQDIPLRYKFQMVLNAQTPLEANSLKFDEIIYLNLCEFRQIEHYQTILAQNVHGPANVIRAVIADDAGAKTFSFFSLNVNKMTDKGISLANDTMYTRQRSTTLILYLSCLTYP